MFKRALTKKKGNKSGRNQGGQFKSAMGKNKIHTEYNVCMTYVQYIHAKNHNTCIHRIQKYFSKAMHFLRFQCSIDTMQYKVVVFLTKRSEKIRQK